MTQWNHDIWVSWLKPTLQTTQPGEIIYQDGKPIGVLLDGGAVMYTDEQTLKDIVKWGYSTPKNRGVVVSGYFNPLHEGHLEMIDAAIEIAHELDEPLYVIVNNDVQVQLKGGCPFHKERTRLRILKSMTGVTNAFLSIDKDRTVAKTLRNLRPKVFVNSGDVQTPNEKEAAVCREIGCEMRFVKLPKIAASSNLLRNVYEWYDKEMKIPY